MNFDLIVIGGGPGGYVAAIRAAQLGLKTACIEKRNALGGTCLNIGCIPSKALLDSSEHYSMAKSKFEKHGIKLSGVQLDLETMMKRKDTVVRQLTQGVQGLFKKNKVEWLQGLGRIVSASGAEKSVEVTAADGTKQVHTAKRVLLATGSEPIELPNLKFNGKTVISSTEALSLTKVPGHMVVVGGGVIGLEMSSVWSRLGAKVTIIEFNSKFLASMDPQAAGELEKALKKQGMEIHLGTKCNGVTETSPGVLTVNLEEVSTQAKSTLTCDIVLVATGRRAYSAGLGLAEAGISTDKAGRVEINDHFETKVPGIYAIGDLVRGAMLAHKAEDEGMAVAEIMVGQKPHINYLAIPNVIYTWPELASVGETEEQAKARGATIKVGTFPFLANGRAKAMDEIEGLVKVIADAKTDRVLGVHITGPRASDMIAEAVTVLEYGGSAEDIARTSHAHPTLAEVMKEAALAVDKRQIHM